MIRYDIAPDALDALVEKRVPGWLDRAKSRTEGFRKKGKYEEKSSIWGEVKPVLMEVQGGAKCCFCERQFEAGDLGRHELDIEHYRPKGSVKKWKCPPELVQEGVSLTEPPGSGKGYYLLAYHLLNYAAACKACNSGLKKDYFPIAGKYDLDGEEPERLTDEQPWLLYPIGRLDVDPEEVITFHGIFPKSTSDDRASRLRGLVTIVFSAYQLRTELCTPVSLRPGASGGGCRTRRDIPAFRFGVKLVAPDGASFNRFGFVFRSRPLRGLQTLARHRPPRTRPVP